MDSDTNLSIGHFRNILEDQTQVLNSLCNRWSQILEQETKSENDIENGGIDDETLGAIRTAIGQAKLLMSQRFKQFGDLIDSCQHQTGQHPTRLSDLSGFWDMISIQIDDVATKFKTLEESCQKGNKY
jgi:disks large-associated protein 5